MMSIREFRLRLIDDLPARPTLPGFSALKGGADGLLWIREYPDPLQDEVVWVGFSEAWERRKRIEMPASLHVLPLCRTAVLIPALNEEEALPAVLGSLPVAQLCAVVVADNGSTDGTARVARAAGAVVVYERTRGYGAACLAGPDYLRSLDPAPEAVVFLDADHPEDARRLSLILSPIGREADLVLGVRVARDGEPGNLHAHARWGNRLVLAAVRLLFGRRSKILRRLGKVAAGGQATTGSSARPQTAPNSSPSQ